MHATRDTFITINLTKLIAKQSKETTTWTFRQLIACNALSIVIFISFYLTLLMNKQSNFVITVSFSFFLSTDCDETCAWSGESISCEWSTVCMDVYVCVRWSSFNISSTFNVFSLMWVTCMLLNSTRTSTFDSPLDQKAGLYDAKYAMIRKENVLDGEKKSQMLNSQVMWFSWVALLTPLSFFTTQQHADGCFLVCHVYFSSQWQVEFT